MPTKNKPGSSQSRSKVYKPPQPPRRGYDGKMLHKGYFSGATGALTENDRSNKRQSPYPPASSEYPGGEYFRAYANIAGRNEPQYKPTRKLKKR